MLQWEAARAPERNAYQPPSDEGGKSAIRSFYYPLVEPRAFSTPKDTDNIKRPDLCGQALPLSQNKRLSQ